MGINIKKKNKKCNELIKNGEYYEALTEFTDIIIEYIENKEKFNNFNISDIFRKRGEILELLTDPNKSNKDLIISENITEMTQEDVIYYYKYNNKVPKNISFNRQLSDEFNKNKIKDPLNILKSDEQEKINNFISNLYSSIMKRNEVNIIYYINKIKKDININKIKDPFDILEKLLQCISINGTETLRSCFKILISELMIPYSYMTYFKKDRIHDEHKDELKNNINNAIKLIKLEEKPETGLLYYLEMIRIVILAIPENYHYTRRWGEHIGEIAAIVWDYDIDSMKSLSKAAYEELIEYIGQKWYKKVIHMNFLKLKALSNGRTIDDIDNIINKMKKERKGMTGSWRVIYTGLDILYNIMISKKTPPNNDICMKCFNAILSYKDFNCTTWSSCWKIRGKVMEILLYLMHHPEISNDAKTYFVDMKKNITRRELRVIANSRQEYWLLYKVFQTEFINQINEHNYDSDDSENIDIISIMSNNQRSALIGIENELKNKIKTEKQKWDAEFKKRYEEGHNIQREYFYELKGYISNLSDMSDIQNQELINILNNNDITINDMKDTMDEMNEKFNELAKKEKSIHKLEEYINKLSDISQISELSDSLHDVLNINMTNTENMNNLLSNVNTDLTNTIKQLTNKLEEESKQYQEQYEKLITGEQHLLDDLSEKYHYLKEEMKSFNDNTNNNINNQFDIMKQELKNDINDLESYAAEHFEELKITQKKFHDQELNQIEQWKDSLLNQGIVTNQKLDEIQNKLDVIADQILKINNQKIAVDHLEETINLMKNAGLSFENFRIQYEIEKKKTDEKINIIKERTDIIEHLCEKQSILVKQLEEKVQNGNKRLSKKLDESREKLLKSQNIIKSAIKNLTDIALNIKDDTSHIIDMLVEEKKKKEIGDGAFAKVFVSGISRLNPKNNDHNIKKVKKNKNQINIKHNNEHKKQYNEQRNKQSGSQSGSQSSSNNKMKSKKKNIEINNINRVNAFLK